MKGLLTRSEQTESLQWSSMLDPQIPLGLRLVVVSVWV